MVNVNKVNDGNVFEFMVLSTATVVPLGDNGQNLHCGSSKGPAFLISWLAHLDQLTGY